MAGDRVPHAPVPADVKPGSRVLSLRQVRQYLHAYPAADGTSVTAALQILEGACPNLVRTLPTLSSDEADPNDLAEGGEDHAVDALRYGLMGRPSAVKRPVEAVNEPSDFEARKLLAEVERRRRVAGKRYIGSELNDPRHLNYQRYYGPSD
jgi:hypothetical protein